MGKFSLYLELQREIAAREHKAVLRSAFKKLEKKQQRHVMIWMARMAANDSLRAMTPTDALEIIAKLGLVLDSAST